MRLNFVADQQFRQLPAAGLPGGGRQHDRPTPEPGRGNPVSQAGDQGARRCVMGAAHAEPVRAHGPHQRTGQGTLDEFSLGGFQQLSGYKVGRWRATTSGWPGWITTRSPTSTPDCQGLLQAVHWNWANAGTAHPASACASSARVRLYLGPTPAWGRSTGLVYAKGSQQASVHGPPLKGAAFQRSCSGARFSAHRSGCPGGWPSV